MRSENYETLAWILFFWFLIIQIRNIKRVLFRIKVEKRIYESIRFLRRRGILGYYPDKVFRYKAVLGYQGLNPKKVIFIKSGVHGGLEMFPIYVCLRVLEYLHFKCGKLLTKHKVQIIVIPIVNYWGFKNYKRTHWFTDLVRNSKHKTKHKNQRYFLRGWGISLKELHIWFFALLKCSTWYFQGFWRHAVTSALITLLTDFHIKTKGNLYCHDLHSGNTSKLASCWTQELFKGKNKALPSFIQRVCRKHNVILGGIDYGTNGGIYEEVAENTGDDDFIGLTHELSVFDYYSNPYYAAQYFFGTVFEPAEKIFNKKFLQAFNFLFELIEENIKAEVVEVVKKNEIEESRTIEEILKAS